MKNSSGEMKRYYGGNYVKILVMGGNQFLGKALCESLLTLGHTVFALNRGNRKM